MKAFIFCCLVFSMLACSNGKNYNQANEDQQTINEMKQSLDTSNMELILERDTTP